jgi:phosphoribosyl-dephospho-CoA transferase
LHHQLLDHLLLMVVVVVGVVQLKTAIKMGRAVQAAEVKVVEQRHQLREQRIQVVVVGVVMPQGKQTPEATTEVQE